MLFEVLFTVFFTVFDPPHTVFHTVIVQKDQIPFCVFFCVFLTPSPLFFPLLMHHLLFDLFPVKNELVNDPVCACSDLIFRVSSDVVSLG